MMIPRRRQRNRPSASATTASGCGQHGACTGRTHEEASAILCRCLCHCVSPVVSASIWIGRC